FILVVAGAAGSYWSGRLHCRTTGLRTKTTTERFDTHSVDPIRNRTPVRRDVDYVVAGVTFLDSLPLCHRRRTEGTGQRFHGSAYSLLRRAFHEESRRRWRGFLAGDAFQSFSQ